MALTSTVDGKVVYDVDVLLLFYHNRSEAASSETSFFNAQFYIFKASIVKKAAEFRIWSTRSASSIRIREISYARGLPWPLSVRYSLRLEVLIQLTS